MRIFKKRVEQKLMKTAILRDSEQCYQKSEYFLFNLLSNAVLRFYKFLSGKRQGVPVPKF